MQPYRQGAVNTLSCGARMESPHRTISPLDGKRSAGWGSRLQDLEDTRDALPHGCKFRMDGQV